MVKLQKDLPTSSKSISIDSAKQKLSLTSKTQNQQEDDLGIGEESTDYKNELDDFAREVLEKLIEDSVPPIPNNFSLYFDRMLDEKSNEFKKQIMQILELERSNEDEKQISLEKRMKEAFLLMKQILQIVATIYKNLNLMNEIATKRNKEISTMTNPIALQNLITSLTHDIEKLTNIVKKQTGSIKELYHQSASIVSEVESETIYDSQFGIYNKRYLLTQLEKELKLINQFGHSSTLVMAKISNEIVKKIKNEKGLLLVSRTISRLLLKTSRRSDTIAHYGDGIFALLLKHSDLFSAKKASERLSDLVSSTNFFLGESEIQLDISIGIAKLDTQRSIDDTIKCALAALEQADRDSEAKYVVCPSDE